ncbi:MAG: CotH kinase family protein [Flavobacteriales bacterium]|nr:CotH kinase family protein [Flavobacteriales bacterium]
MRRLPAMVLFVCHTAVMAQPELYDIGSVREMRLYFAEADWSDLLDTLFLAGEDGRLIGDLVIDGTTIPDVGVRYKGYSSYSPTRIKNPFNIKLNEVHAGQKYQGIDKIKLSNVIQDPSFLREALSYEIARQYMPASQANFANLYVNDELIGLYTNVEDVNKEFVDKHFGSRGNTFFKGNPATVDLNGENANLSDGPGPDSTAYYDLYSIESDHGWGELLTLIDVLNNDPEHVDEVLNVDRALWMHAFNYTVINFDSYVGYAQNYYLYKDDNDRWNPILWDLNMSFASFRLTDASTHWNGFSVTQAPTIDPLQHYTSVSVLPRPLLRNLFANPTYRRMYLAHMRTIVDENFADHSFHDRAEAMRATIRPYVLADPNKFYSDQAFEDNLDVTVSDLIEYPGITELMDARTVYLYDQVGFANRPVISDVAHAPETVDIGEELTITAAIAGCDTAFLAYRFVEGGLFQHIELKDDGQSGDGGAGDGIFGARITPTSNLVEFYCYAENTDAGTFDPPRAEYAFHTIHTRLDPGQVVINEFVAYNSGVTRDEHGEADDWIELFNPTAAPVSTAGLHLSDDPQQPAKWPLPTRTIAPGEYLLIWADDQEGQGEEHANFKLDASGETLSLAYADGTSIDRVVFGAQYPISSTGRFPNGIGDHRELLPTPGLRNTLDGSSDLDRYVRLWPNPSAGDVFVIVDADGTYEVQVLNADGRAITAPIARSTRELIHFPTTNLAAGAYILQVRTTDRITRQPFILIE